LFTRNNDTHIEICTRASEHARRLFKEKRYYRKAYFGGFFYGRCFYPDTDTDEQNASKL